MYRPTKGAHHGRAVPHPWPLGPGPGPADPRARRGNGDRTHRGTAHRGPPLPTPDRGRPGSGRRTGQGGQPIGPQRLEGPCPAQAPSRALRCPHPGPVRAAGAGLARRAGRPALDRRPKRGPFSRPGGSDEGGNPLAPRCPRRPGPARGKASAAHSPGRARRAPAHPHVPGGHDRRRERPRPRSPFPRAHPGAAHPYAAPAGARGRGHPHHSRGRGSG